MILRTLNAITNIVIPPTKLIMESAPSIIAPISVPINNIEGINIIADIIKRTKTKIIGPLLIFSFEFRLLNTFLRFKNQTGI
mgnify:FL=1